MTIAPERCLQLLENLDVGSPIAEDDNLLFESRVETAVFSELVSDRIDIVRGTKGSGKSALYRLIHEFIAPELLRSRRLAVLAGVEMKGDPIFLRFRPEFEHLDETGFENFWRIYFISLVTSQLLAPESRYTTALVPARREVAQFRKLAKENGFPIQESRFSLPSLVAWVLGKIGSMKRIEGTMTPDGVPLVGVEFGDDPWHSERTPVFVGVIHSALMAVLEKANIRLWIMIDRLDEAFPRRSAVETKALRALLRSTLAFKNPRLRLKIFLRDDIFTSITDRDDGFVALTHVMSRCSPVLRWSRDQILQLIVNRVFADESPLVRYFEIDKQQILNSADYREHSFYKSFPKTLRAGAGQSSTLDWLCKHCEDANGVITARDIIDLIGYAKHKEFDILNANRRPCATLLSPTAVLQGHAEMSIGKRVNYLKAEFPHFWADIEKFENQKAEQRRESLHELLGERDEFVKDLCAIGFLKHNPKADTYVVPFLYRPGLKMRQGKSILGTKRTGRRQH